MTLPACRWHEDGETFHLPKHPLPDVQPSLLVEIFRHRGSHTRPLPEPSLDHLEEAA